MVFSLHSPDQGWIGHSDLCIRFSPSFSPISLGLLPLLWTCSIRPCFSLPWLWGFSLLRFVPLLASQLEQSLPMINFKVSLAPSPTMFAKNEWENHRLGPVVIPGLVDGEWPSPPTSCVYSFLLPGLYTFGLLCPCGYGLIFAPLLIGLYCFNVAPGCWGGWPCKLPWAHEICFFMSALAFLCSHSLERIWDVCQWVFSSSFCQRYLAHQVMVRCEKPFPCWPMSIGKNNSKVHLRV